jgi:hypothetical protein
MHSATPLSRKHARRSSGDALGGARSSNGAELCCFLTCSSLPPSPCWLRRIWRENGVTLLIPALRRSAALSPTGRSCFCSKSRNASSASPWNSFMLSRRWRSSACQVSSSNWTRLPGLSILRVQKHGTLPARAMMEPAEAREIGWRRVLKSRRSAEPTRPRRLICAEPGPALAWAARLLVSM